MTIKQLYDWALQNDAQNFDIGIVNQDHIFTCDDGKTVKYISKVIYKL